LTEIDDTQASLGFILNDVTRLLRRNFDQRVKCFGLTLTQSRALMHIARDEGLNQAKLAEALEVQPITLTRLVDRMEAAGWVERRSDPKDRRVARLFLTAKAQPMLSQMREIANATREDAIAGISVENRALMMEMLQHMKRGLIEAEEKASQTPALVET